ncbi:MAG: Na+/H+ antiporter NhaA [Ignavibacteriaceae bacterium]
MKSTQLLKEFLKSEQAGGFILIACTVVSLIISNSSLGSSYIGIWETKMFGHTIGHWINDALMAVFFLLIGLELEREIYAGELADMKKAILPITAALGGMIVPAALFFAFNAGLSTQSGLGIPMATDIAFALGVLSLLGKRVPLSLKVFLTALAVIDDLGAIIIIALFYTKTLSMLYLALSLGVFAVLMILNKLKINSLVPYILGGIVMWYFMLNSGVHATITGVLLAFAIPFRKGNDSSPSYIMQHFLHAPVAYFILPVFALANTAIIISGGFSSIISEPLSLGIIAGLTLGKPLGVFLFSFLLVKMKLSVLPDDVSFGQILGAGMMAGIGFTMSIFITLLAFENPGYIDLSKISIMIASLLSGIIGFFTLKVLSDKKATN